MRRVLEFLIGHRVFILFLFLLSFSFYFIIQFQEYQNARFLHSANAVSASVHTSRSNIQEYFNLQEINDDLVQQNAELLMQRRDSLYAFLPDSNSWMVNLDLGDFRVVPAKIIYNTVSKLNNTFVIDKGNSHGLKKGMGIASSKGIVGKIIHVNRNYSLCLSILNTQNPVVMPKILELQNKSGRLEWKGKNPKTMSLKDIHRFEEIDTGFHIVSSEYSLNFPENVPVGKIKNISTSGESFYNVSIELSADLRKTRYVYVFQNQNKEEIDSLLSINPY